MPGWKRVAMRDEFGQFAGVSPYVHWWHNFERPPWLQTPAGAGDHRVFAGLALFDRTVSDVKALTGEQVLRRLEKEVERLEQAGLEMPEDVEDAFKFFLSHPLPQSGTMDAGQSPLPKLIKGELDYLALPSHATPGSEPGEAPDSRWGKNQIGEVPEDTVIVGLIDDAIAIGHPRFQRRHKNGTWESRILCAWQQDGVYDGTSPHFGAEVHKEQIDTALNDPVLSGSGDPGALYRHLFPAAPSGRSTLSDIAQTLMSRAGHGTHVSDLACGEDPMIPSDDRDRVSMITVGLPSRASVGMSGTFLENYVVFAMRRIVQLAEEIWEKQHPGKAGGFPVVINLSYGQQAGPKTGTSLIEKEFLQLQKGREGKAPLELVMPAGNDNLTRCHARRQMGKAQVLEIPWRILPQDQSSNFVEVWTDIDGTPGDTADLPLELQIVPPGVPQGKVDWISPNADSRPVDYDYFQPTTASGHTAKTETHRVYLQRVAVPDVTPEGIAGAVQGQPRAPLLMRQRYVIAARPTEDLMAPDKTAPAGLWTIRLRWAASAQDAIPAFGKEVYANVQVDQDLDATSRTNYRSYFDSDRYRTHMPNGRALDTYAYGPEEEELTENGQENLEPANAYWPVQRKGTQNSLANHRRVVAAAGYRASDGRPAPYSSTTHPSSRIPDEIKTSVRKGPTAAFPTDETPSLSGILAAGTHAGGQTRLQGTSFAAPQATRWIVRGLLENPDNLGILAQMVEAARAHETPRVHDHWKGPEAKIGEGRLPFIGAKDRSLPR